MGGNRSPHRLALVLTALSTVAATALTGCNAGGSKPGDGGQTPGTAGGAGKTNPAPLRTNYMTGHPARIDLLTLNRLSEKMVAARFRVTNVGHKDIIFPIQLADEGDGSSVSATSLIDAKHRKQYFPFIAQDGKCVCTLLTGSLGSLDPGKSLVAYSYFPAPPRSVQQVVVRFPLTPPFLNVPFGTAHMPVPVPRGQVDRDPRKLTLRPPKIISLVSLSADLDNTKSTRESAEKVEIRVSADVLFELNKAELTARAKDVLEEVAKKIERSAAKTIHVDGYTDNTGGPSINEPLSDDRAANVKKTLERLVDRNVTFKAQGHGADDPVASNDTEEGRQQNRRVTITFAK